MCWGAPVCRCILFFVPVAVGLWLLCPGGCLPSFSVAPSVHAWHAAFPLVSAVVLACLLFRCGLPCFRFSFACCVSASALRVCSSARPVSSSALRVCRFRALLFCFSALLPVVFFLCPVAVAGRCQAWFRCVVFLARLAFSITYFIKSHVFSLLNQQFFCGANINSYICSGYMVCVSSSVQEEELHPWSIFLNMVFPPFSGCTDWGGKEGLCLCPEKKTKTVGGMPQRLRVHRSSV